MTTENLREVKTRPSEWGVSFSCKWQQYSQAFIFSLLCPTRPSSSSIPRCTQETLAPLKVESVFLFVSFSPHAGKAPVRLSPRESLTQVCSDVPTFLDSIPSTGTVYRLSRECRFPAQVLIRPCVVRECDRNSTALLQWLLEMLEVTLCTDFTINSKEPVSLYPSNVGKSSPVKPGRILHCDGYRGKNDISMLQHRVKVSARCFTWTFCMKPAVSCASFQRYVSPAYL